MVCDHVEFSTIKIQMEVFTAPDDSKSLSFRLRVSLFNWGQGPACISNNISVISGFLSLCQDGAKANRTGFNNDIGFSFRIEVAHHRGFDQSVFEGSQCVFLLFTPQPFRVLLCEFPQRLCE